MKSSDIVFALFMRKYEEAYGEILNKYYQIMIDTAMRYVDNIEDAKDIASTAIMRFHLGEHWRTIEIPRISQLRGRLTLITLRTAIDFIKRGETRNKAESTYAHTLDEYESLLIEEDLEEPNIIDVQLRLFETIASSSPSAAEAFILYIFHHLTREQVAKKLGITPFTVRNHIAKAYKLLEEDGVSLRKNKYPRHLKSCVKDCQ